MKIKNCDNNNCFKCIAGNNYFLLSGKCYECNVNCKTKENDNCKVTKFKLILNEIMDNNCGIEFYCGPYN